MVLLPGCGCCGCACQYPLKYSTDSVEVVIESTGTDAFYSWASNMRDCQCSGIVGSYYRGEGWASYKPPSGTYSLSLDGNISSVFVGGSSYASYGQYAYSDGLIDLRVELVGCSPGQNGITFRLGGETCTLSGYGATWSFNGFNTFCAGLPNYATAPRIGVNPAYNFLVDFSCANNVYTSSASRRPVYGQFGYGYPLPSVTHNPTENARYAEFGVWTWMPDPTQSKTNWQSSSQTSLAGCGPAVFTDGPQSGAFNSATAASVKISRVTVKYNDGTPDFNLLG